ncbi:MAG: hypothetical protein SFW36_10850 [Leptolyngbyaceae cyanobacterium bins.59]|nr:hypothetical protein [Leptolyngbyaceae cyanobacterium bins.59]
MRLAELKEKVLQEWQDYCWYKQSVCQLEAFKPEIKKQFGDMRCRSTWEKALCYFRAMNAQIGLLDAYTLILYTFNFTPDRWDYEYRHQIIEQFLTLPDGLDLIRLGLEQLFSKDFTCEERGQADGFYQLVPESARREFGSFPIEPTRRLLEASAVSR